MFGLYLRQTVSSMERCSVFGVGEGSWGWCLFVSCMSRFFAFCSRFWWLYFGLVKKRFWVLWCFLSMYSSFRLVMLCSFLPAVIRASSVLQKLLYCGLVKYCLKCEKIFLSRLGMPDKNLNIPVILFNGQISFDTI